MRTLRQAQLVAKEQDRLVLVAVGVVGGGDSIDEECDEVEDDGPDRHGSLVMLYEKTG